jgi:sulfur-oxidizing protein SoxY
MQIKEFSMHTRRDLLSHSSRVALMLSSLGWLPTAAKAQTAAPAPASATGYNTAAFEAKSIPDLMKAFGASAPVESKDVTVTGPDIAENGAVVPVAAATTLAGAKRLLILVEKNPSVLSASFEVSDAVDSSFATRVKMGQSSNVYAVAMMGDGKVLFAQKEVKVTLGGCGG